MKFSTALLLTTTLATDAAILRAGAEEKMDLISSERCFAAFEALGCSMKASKHGRSVKCQNQNIDNLATLSVCDGEAPIGIL